MLTVVVACAAVLFTGVDPILVTEYSVVFSAIALPLTYLPILIVANDPGYMGEHVNGRALNIAASVYLVIILVCLTGCHPPDDRHRSRPMTTSRNDFPDAPRPTGAWSTPACICWTVNYSMPTRRRSASSTTSTSTSRRTSTSLSRRPRHG